MYVPQATLYHRSWRTRAEYVPLHWRYGRGQGAFYAKHVSLKDWYMLGRLGGHVRSCLSEAARYAKRQPRVALGQLVYAVATIAGALEWLLSQRGTSNSSNE
jgi:hypothetical protein